MTKITFGDYFLTPEDGRFSLFRYYMHVNEDGERVPKKSKAKDGTITESYVSLGYSMTFENALQRILNDMLERKLKDETITLRNYMKEYASTKNEILEFMGKV